MLGTSYSSESRTAYTAPSTQTTSRQWLQVQPIEVLLTATALVAMLAGLAAEYAEVTVIAFVFYTIAYIAGGKTGLEAGLESLRQRKIDVDILMILAAVGAAIVGEPFEGALLLFLFSLSNVLQDYALDRTRHAIQALMTLRPSQALVRRGSQKVFLPIEQLQIGDHIIVRPGERIPMDGTVIAGQSHVNQASITGEPLPIYKGVNDDVLAGTLNENGSLDIRVSRLAQDSTIARLIKLVEEARSEKAATQRFLDTAEQYYAIGVIAFTALAIFIPFIFLGHAFQPTFYRAMTILVAASPCALIISTPASILSAIGNGARRGILFKGGVHVEQAATIKVVAFDKTGTLTTGKPRVTQITPLPTWSGSTDDLLALVAAVEEKSEHVLAQAVVQEATKRNLIIPTASNFQADAGHGVQAMVAGRHLRVGTPRYLAHLTSVGLSEAKTLMAEMETRGETAVLIAEVAQDQAHILGVISFADTLRPQAAHMVQQLKANGIEKVVMLTGDNQQAAQTIAQQVGIEHTYAELLPADKMAILKQLKQTDGPVAMIGDGINDAPALATATLGLAMGAAGTDVALETADIVLMSDDLLQIPYVMTLSRRTRHTLLTNLAFAGLMIAIMVAAIFTVQLPLPLAVIGHEGGTVLVSLNGLRLLTYKGK